MVNVIGVGDNTVDQYVHLDQMFPGGNAVNVAVLAHRLGHPAAYLGWLGNDVYARLILDSLQAEGVDTSHCRIVEATNAHGKVNLVDGDRVWGDSTPGVCPLIELSDDDLAFIRRYDLTHTSIYSYIESDLKRLSDASNTLSFDFSDNWTCEYLSENVPWVDIAILSYPEHSPAETEELMQWLHQQGPQIVLVTQGALGATVFDGSQFYRQGIVETRVLDTLGAGDAFAARFLVDYLGGTSIQDAMAHAAASAAETCGYYGAFGYGVAIPDQGKE